MCLPQPRKAPAPVIRGRKLTSFTDIQALARNFHSDLAKAFQLAPARLEKLKYYLRQVRNEIKYERDFVSAVYKYDQLVVEFDLVTIFDNLIRTWFFFLETFGIDVLVLLL